MLVARGLLIAVAGCNPAFGIDETSLREYFDAMPRPDADPRVDLDRDGIKDVEDACLAPATDALVDSDFDGTPNASDACPFDMAAQGDADGDGIGDACDPEPIADRVRCVMAFTDPDFDMLLWTPRSSPGWILYYPRMLAAGSGGLLVAGWPFEAPGVTAYDITGRVYQTTRSLSVIPRIAGPEDESLIGCSVTRDAAGWSLVTRTTTTQIGALAAAFSQLFRLQIVLDPAAAAGYSCRVWIDGVGVAQATSLEARPYGNLAMRADGAASVFGVTVYER